MFGRTSDPPGPSVGEELRETRRRGSPAGVRTPVRSTHSNLGVGAGSALPGFLKRRGGYRGQQQRQHGSGSLPGMEGRPSALRMALQGGGDSARRGSEASVSTNDPHHQHHQHQQRRRSGSGDENRRRGSTTTTAASWELCEPAQPRGSSPVSRPPSVRQRQGELNVSQSRAAAQARSSTRAAGGDVGNNKTTGANRRTTFAESSSSRRGSSSSFGGNSRGSTNNQAEDTMPPASTPRRLSSSSGRATSCPSGSPYQESGFHRADAGCDGHNNSSGGRRISRRGEYDDRSNDSAYSRRSSCEGVGSGKHRDSLQHERGQGDGGGAPHSRGSPSTAPAGSASTELDRRLPSIDGLDINGLAENYTTGGRTGGHGDEESMTQPPSSSLMRQRRAKESLGNSGGRFSSLTAADHSLPAQDNLGHETSGQHCSNNNDDRREGGGREHACVGAAGASGDNRLDHTGRIDSGGLAAPGNSNSGGGVALQARRIGTNSGGGSLRSDDQVAGRSCAADPGSNNKNSHKGSDVRNTSSNSSINTSRECLVGLQNLGNTCFMNACLQCLLHTDALVNLFRRRLQHEQRLGSHNNRSPTRGALAEAFKELVALVEASPAHSNVSPAQVKRLIGKFAPHLSGYGQQDCQEFLRFFLDGLAEDLNRRDVGGNNHRHHQRAKRASQQQEEIGTGRGGGGGGGGPDQQQRSTPPPPPVVPPMSDEEISRLTAEQQADRAWALHLARNDSEITSMFCGQLQSRISCLSCSNVSFCFDPFFDISVPLPSDSSRGRGGDEGCGYGGRDARGSYGSGGGGGRSSTSGVSRATTTLEDCLRVFSTEETLDGDNRPVCGNCRRRRKSVKSLAVHRFPPILVIHLKRFQYNSTSRTKLSTAVDFPIGSGLDLLPYSTPSARPTSSGSTGSTGTSTSGEENADLGDRRWGSKRANNGGSSKNGFRADRSGSSTRSGNRSSPPLYELYAVCNHMGGLQGGHYTAHCRSGASDCRGRASAGEWHTFDDARVGPITTSRVGGAAAYVLFYRLVTNNTESHHT